LQTRDWNEAPGAQPICTNKPEEKPIGTALRFQSTPILGSGAMLIIS
jgi:hypothetical protein